jgi:hypothetical protein
MDITELRYDNPKGLGHLKFWEFDENGFPKFSGVHRIIINNYMLSFQIFRSIHGEWILRYPEIDTYFPINVFPVPKKWDIQIPVIHQYIPWDIKPPISIYEKIFDWFSEKYNSIQSWNWDRISVRPSNHWEMLQYYPDRPWSESLSNINSTCLFGSQISSLTTNYRDNFSTWKTVNFSRKNFGLITIGSQKKIKEICMILHLVSRRKGVPLPEEMVFHICSFFLVLIN